MKIIVKKILTTLIFNWKVFILDLGPVLRDRGSFLVKKYSAQVKWA